MKNIELLYKTEDASTMLVYFYDVHAWKYDCKFWLVDGKWCTDLDGKIVVGELRKNEKELINKYDVIIKQHEKENQNYLAFYKCRKRTCICKSCEKYCDCGSCKGKINHCDKMQLKV